MPLNNLEKVTELFINDTTTSSRTIDAAATVEDRDNVTSNVAGTSESKDLDTSRFSDSGKSSSCSPTLLDCSFDSGIAGVLLDSNNMQLHKQIQQCQRIILALERDREHFCTIRNRLSKITERKKKQLNESEYFCNVCCAEIDPEDAKTYVKCYICQKHICRSVKCGDWLAKTAQWECELCQTSKESLAQTSSWVADQISFNKEKLVYPIRARSEIFIPISECNDSSIHFESVSQIGANSAAVTAEQKLKIREYVEEIVANLLGGNLDTISVNQLSKSENYLPAPKSNGRCLQNGSVLASNSETSREVTPIAVNVPDFTQISENRLRQMIQKIIAESVNMPSLSTTHAVSEIALDRLGKTADNTPLTNGLRHRTEHYFEPTIYQDLLATAVLNKIVDKQLKNPDVFERLPDLTRVDDGCNINAVFDENFNTENQSTTSVSSVEPRSDCSYTDMEQILNTIDEKTLETNIINADRESVISDYLANHMVPLPNLSEMATESEEDDYLSVTSSAVGDGTWENNWLFKKKKPTLGGTVAATSIGMLVPDPKEDVRAKIGDTAADEVSDLSELGSDTDDSLDLLRSKLDPINDRLINKHLIGGQNSKEVLDELIERSSMISNTLSSDLEQAYIETSNEHVIDASTKSEAINVDVNQQNSYTPEQCEVILPPAGFDDLNSNPLTASDDFIESESCTGFSTIEIVEQTVRTPSVVEILAAMALGPMLAVPAVDQPTTLTASEFTALNELKDLALAEIKARYVELTPHSLCVIPEEPAENVIDIKSIPTPDEINEGIINEFENNLIATMDASNIILGSAESDVETISKSSIQSITSYESPVIQEIQSKEKCNTQTIQEFDLMKEEISEIAILKCSNSGKQLIEQPSSSSKSYDISEKFSESPKITMPQIFENEEHLSKKISVASADSDRNVKLFKDKLPSEAIEFVLSDVLNSVEKQKEITSPSIMDDKMNRTITTVLSKPTALPTEESTDILTGDKVLEIQTKTQTELINPIPKEEITFKITQFNEECLETCTHNVEQVVLRITNDKTLQNTQELNPLQEENKIYETEYSVGFIAQNTDNFMQTAPSVCILSNSQSFENTTRALIENLASEYITKHDDSITQSTEQYASLDDSESIILPTEDDDTLPTNDKISQPTQLGIQISDEFNLSKTKYDLSEPDLLSETTQLGVLTLEESNIAKSEINISGTFPTYDLECLTPKNDNKAYQIVPLECTKSDNNPSEQSTVSIIKNEQIVPLEDSENFKQAQEESTETVEKSTISETTNLTEATSQFEKKIIDKMEYIIGDTERSEDNESLSQLSEESKQTASLQFPFSDIPLEDNTEAGEDKITLEKNLESPPKTNVRICDTLSSNCSQNDIQQKPECKVAKTEFQTSDRLISETTTLQHAQNVTLSEIENELFETAPSQPLESITVDKSIPVEMNKKITETKETFKNLFSALTNENNTESSVLDGTKWKLQLTGEIIDDQIPIAPLKYVGSKNQTENVITENTSQLSEQSFPVIADFNTAIQILDKSTKAQAGNTVSSIESLDEYTYSLTECLQNNKRLSGESSIITPDNLLPETVLEQSVNTISKTTNSNYDQNGSHPTTDLIPVTEEKLISETTLSECSFMNIKLIEQSTGALKGSESVTQPSERELSECIFFDVEPKKSNIQPTKENKMATTREHIIEENTYREDIQSVIPPTTESISGSKTDASFEGTKSFTQIQISQVDASEDLESCVFHTGEDFTELKIGEAATSECSKSKEQLLDKSKIATKETLLSEISDSEDIKSVILPNMESNNEKNYKTEHFQNSLENIEGKSTVGLTDNTISKTAPLQSAELSKQPSAESFPIPKNIKLFECLENFEFTVNETCIPELKDDKIYEAALEIINYPDEKFTEAAMDEQVFKTKIYKYAFQDTNHAKESTITLQSPISESMPLTDSICYNETIFSDSLMASEMASLKSEIQQINILKNTMSETSFSVPESSTQTTEKSATTLDQDNKTNLENLEFTSNENYVPELKDAKISETALECIVHPNGEAAKDKKISKIEFSICSGTYHIEESTATIKNLPLIDSISLAQPNNESTLSDVQISETESLNSLKSETQLLSEVTGFSNKTIETSATTLIQDNSTEILTRDLKVELFENLEFAGNENYITELKHDKISAAASEFIVHPNGESKKAAKDEQIPETEIICSDTNDVEESTVTVSQLKDEKISETALEFIAHPNGEAAKDENISEIEFSICSGTNHVDESTVTIKIAPLIDSISLAQPNNESTLSDGQISLNSLKSEEYSTQTTDTTATTLIKDNTTEICTEDLKIALLQNLKTTGSENDIPELKDEKISESALELNGESTEVAIYEKISETETSKSFDTNHVQEATVINRNSLADTTSLTDSISLTQPYNESTLSDDHISETTSSKSETKDINILKTKTCCVLSDTVLSEIPESSTQSNETPATTLINDYSTKILAEDLKIELLENLVFAGNENDIPELKNDKNAEAALKFISHPTEIPIEPANDEKVSEIEFYICPDSNHLEKSTVTIKNSITETAPLADSISVTQLNNEFTGNENSIPELKDEKISEVALEYIASPNGESKKAAKDEQIPETEIICSDTNDVEESTVTVSQLKDEKISETALEFIAHPNGEAAKDENISEIEFSICSGTNHVDESTVTIKIAPLIDSISLAQPNNESTLSDGQISLNSLKSEEYSTQTTDTTATTLIKDNTTEICTEDLKIALLQNLKTTGSENDIPELKDEKISESALELNGESTEVAIYEKISETETSKSFDTNHVQEATVINRNSLADTTSLTDSISLTQPYNESTLSDDHISETTSSKSETKDINILKTKTCCVLSDTVLSEIPESSTQSNETPATTLINDYSTKILAEDLKIELLENLVFAGNENDIPELKNDKNAEAALKFISHPTEIPIEPANDEKVSEIEFYICPDSNHLEKSTVTIKNSITETAPLADSISVTQLNNEFTGNENSIPELKDEKISEVALEYIASPNGEAATVEKISDSIPVTQPNNESTLSDAQISETESLNSLKSETQQTKELKNTMSETIFSEVPESSTQTKKTSATPIIEDNSTDILTEDLKIELLEHLELTGNENEIPKLKDDKISEAALEFIAYPNEKSIEAAEDEKISEIEFSICSDTKHVGESQPNYESTLSDAHRLETESLNSLKSEPQQTKELKNTMSETILSEVPESSTQTKETSATPIIEDNSTDILTEDLKLELLENLELTGNENEIPELKDDKISEAALEFVAYPNEKSIEAAEDEKISEIEFSICSDTKHVGESQPNYESTLSDAHRLETESLNSLKSEPQQTKELKNTVSETLLTEVPESSTQTNETSATTLIQDNNTEILTEDLKIDLVENSEYTGNENDIPELKDDKISEEAIEFIAYPNEKSIEVAKDEKISEIEFSICSDTKHVRESSVTNKNSIAETAPLTDSISLTQPNNESTLSDAQISETESLNSLKSETQQAKQSKNTMSETVLSEDPGFSNQTNETAAIPLIQDSSTEILTEDFKIELLENLELTGNENEIHELKDDKISEEAIEFIAHPNEEAAHDEKISDAESSTCSDTNHVEESTITIKNSIEENPPLADSISLTQPNNESTLSDAQISETESLNSLKSETQQTKELKNTMSETLLSEVPESSTQTNETSATPLIQDNSTEILTEDLKIDLVENSEFTGNENNIPELKDDKISEEAIEFIAYPNEKSIEAAEDEKISEIEFSICSDTKHVGESSVTNKNSIAETAPLTDSISLTQPNNESTLSDAQISETESLNSLKSETQQTKQSKNTMSETVLSEDPGFSNQTNETATPLIQDNSTEILTEDLKIDLLENLELTGNENEIHELKDDKISELALEFIAHPNEEAAHDEKISDAESSTCSDTNHVEESTITIKNSIAENPPLADSISSTQPNNDSTLSDAQIPETEFLNSSKSETQQTKELKNTMSETVLSEVPESSIQTNETSASPIIEDNSTDILTEDLKIELLEILEFAGNENDIPELTNEKISEAASEFISLPNEESLETAKDEKVSEIEFFICSDLNHLEESADTIKNSNAENSPLADSISLTQANNESTLSGDLIPEKKSVNNSKSETQQTMELKNTMSETILSEVPESSTQTNETSATPIIEDNSTDILTEELNIALLENSEFAGNENDIPQLKDDKISELALEFIAHPNEEASHDKKISEAENSTCSDTNPVAESTITIKNSIAENPPLADSISLTQPNNESTLSDAQISETESLNSLKSETQQAKESKNTMSETVLSEVPESSTQTNETSATPIIEDNSTDILTEDLKIELFENLELTGNENGILELKDDKTFEPALEFILHPNEEAAEDEKISEAGICKCSDTNHLEESTVTIKNSIAETAPLADSISSTQPNNDSTLSDAQISETESLNSLKSETQQTKESKNTMSETVLSEVPESSAQTNETSATTLIQDNITEILTEELNIALLENSEFAGNENDIPQLKDDKISELALEFIAHPNEEASHDKKISEAENSTCSDTNPVAESTITIKNSIAENPPLADSISLTQPNNESTLSDAQISETESLNSLKSETQQAKESKNTMSETVLSEVPESSTQTNETSATTLFQDNNTEILTEDLKIDVVENSEFTGNENDIPEPQDEKISEAAFELFVQHNGDSIEAAKDEQIPEIEFSICSDTNRVEISTVTSKHLISETAPLIDSISLTHPNGQISDTAVLNSLKTESQQTKTSKNTMSENFLSEVPVPFTQTTEKSATTLIKDDSREILTEDLKIQLLQNFEFTGNQNYIPELKDDKISEAAFELFVHPNGESIEVAKDEKISETEKSKCSDTNPVEESTVTIKKSSDGQISETASSTVLSKSFEPFTENTADNEYITVKSEQVCSKVDTQSSTITAYASFITTPEVTNLEKMDEKETFEYLPAEGAELKPPYDLTALSLTMEINPPANVIMLADQTLIISDPVSTTIASEAQAIPNSKLDTVTEVPSSIYSTAKISNDLVLESLETNMSGEERDSLDESVSPSLTRQPTVVEIGTAEAGPADIIKDTPTEYVKSQSLGNTYVLRKLQRQYRVEDTTPSFEDVSQQIVTTQTQSQLSNTSNSLASLCQKYIHDKHLLAALEKRRRQTLLMHRFLSTFDSNHSDNSTDENSEVQTLILYRSTPPVVCETSPHNHDSDDDNVYIDSFSFKVNDQYTIISYNFINNILFSDQLSYDTNHNGDSQTATVDEYIGKCPDESDILANKFKTFPPSTTNTHTNTITKKPTTYDKHPLISINGTETVIGTSPTIKQNEHKRCGEQSNNVLLTSAVQNQESPQPAACLERHDYNGHVKNFNNRKEYYGDEDGVGVDVGVGEKVDLIEEHEEKDDDDEVSILRRFVPGSIAEREYKKWNNAVEMPNNPYAPEALKRRISGSQERFIDLPNISPTQEHNPLQLISKDKLDVDETDQRENDYKRYSRDYYINNGCTSSQTSPARETSAKPTREILETAQATLNITELDLYKAIPAQVVEDSISQQSMQSSDDSDTIKVYDFKKQATTIIRDANPQEVQVQTASSNAEVKSKVRPTALTFSRSECGGNVTTPTRGSTPTAFKFLQPKRKLLDPSQVLSVDENEPPTVTSPLEKPVIEQDVARSLPSVKALAKAFLLTAKATQPENRWLRKAKIISKASKKLPETSIRSIDTTCLEAAKLEEDVTITSDLSSLETDTSSIYKETENIEDISPSSPSEDKDTVAVRQGALKSNIAFFENLKLK